MGSGCMSKLGGLGRVQMRDHILTDWNDEGSECVTTDDTAIIHDVLRSHFPVINEAKNKTYCFRSLKSVECAIAPPKSLILTHIRDMDLLCFPGVPHSVLVY